MTFPYIIILQLRNSRLLQELGCVTLYLRQGDRSSVPKTFSHFSVVRYYSWDLLSPRTGAYYGVQESIYVTWKGGQELNTPSSPLSPPRLLHYHHSKNHYSSCFTPKVKCGTEKPKRIKQIQTLWPLALWDLKTLKSSSHSFYTI